MYPVCVNNGHLGSIALQCYKTNVVKRWIQRPTATPVQGGGGRGRGGLEARVPK